MKIKRIFLFACLFVITRFAYLFLSCGTLQTQKPPCTNPFGRKWNEEWNENGTLAPPGGKTLRRTTRSEIPKIKVTARRLATAVQWITYCRMMGLFAGY